MNENTRDVLVLLGFFALVGFGYYMMAESDKAKNSSSQQNFHTYKYIDWPEEINQVSKNPDKPDVMEIYQSGDSIFIRYKH